MSIREILRERIAGAGPISIAEYMRLCLTHPEYGYYATRDPFGVAGDFVTAPEISQMFGEMIGLWCLDRWLAMDRPEVALVELGPGRGTLMADVLRVTRSYPEFHEAASLYLVETSPALRLLQEALLTPLHPRVQWLDSLDALPKAATLVVANEFFDALPVHQYVRTHEGWQERMVDLGHDLGFRFVLGEETVTENLPEPPFYRHGAILERSPASETSMAALARHLARVGGAALIVDYGYDVPHAAGDTLQALRAHKPDAVLAHPGEADITAHVNFRALRHQAGQEGVAAHGAVSQGEFLRGLGIEIWATKLCLKASERQKTEILSALERLVSPAAMGDLFKVLAVQHTDIVPPEGF